MNNVQISGASTIAGGTYNQVSIAGSCRIVSDLEANDFRAAGSIHANGKLSAKTINASGAMKVLGDLICDECKLAGGFSVTGNLIASTCRLSGAIKINGEINAESFTLRSNGSVMTTIHGDKIDIDGGNGLFFRPRKQNKALEIEATTIEIDYVSAQRVSGTNIIIGENCNIEVVEYSENLTAHKKAKIGQVIKI